jgi:hypothetical protein
MTRSNPFGQNIEFPIHAHVATLQKFASLHSFRCDFIRQMAPRASSNLIQSIVGHCNCMHAPPPSRNPSYSQYSRIYITLKAKTSSCIYGYKMPILTRHVYNRTKPRSQNTPLYVSCVYKVSSITSLCKCHISI